MDLKNLFVSVLIYYDVYVGLKLGIDFKGQV